MVQSCVASWSGTVSTPGSCANGLSDPAQSFPITGNYTIPRSVSGWDSNGNPISHYSVMSGAQTLTLPACPAAASVTGDPNTYSDTASVAYTASVSPVTINPVSATQDSSGNWNILIGQGCSPVLNGIPSGCSVSYSWTVSGTTYQKWSVVNDGSGQSHTTEVDGPGPLNGPNSSANPPIPAPHWYWDEATNTEQISCTATVTPPAGQGNAFPVTATVNVKVVVPGWQAMGTGGYMQVNANCANMGGAICLYAGPSSGQLGGMNWQAMVTTPLTFGLFAVGELELVQTVTPNQYYFAGPGPSLPHKDPENGLLGLDTEYPYDNYVYIEDHAQGAPTFATNDNPCLALGSCDAAVMQHQFNDYLLYQPPGSDVQWAPLGTFNWSTNGSATIPTGGWANYVSQYGSDSAGTVTPNGSPVLFTSAYSTFPAWTRTDVFPAF